MYYYNASISLSISFNMANSWHPTERCSLLGKPGLLVCHIWGGTEIRTIDHSDEEIVDIVLQILQGMYQSTGVLPTPIQTVVTRWSEDPFSLGSYTPGGPQSTNEDRNNYSKAIPEQGRPRILFSGEGTLGELEAKECTHGALINGMHKAAEIVRFFHPKRSVLLDKPTNYLKRKLKPHSDSKNHKKAKKLKRSAEK